MYKGKVVLCVIPARGGSKGLPGKNVRELLGKPLMAYSIEQARQSRYIDRVIVSTESAAIAEIARQYGAEVPFKRPEDLSRDESGVVAVLLHAMERLEIDEGYSCDIIVLLHVTAPLRRVEDIDNCIEQLVEEGSDNVFSVTEAHRNPYFNMVEVGESAEVKLVREGDFTTRQSAPKVFDMNASIYVWWKERLKEEKRTLMKKSSIYVMPKERSVDIDDLLDFRIAEIFLKERQ